MVATPPLAWANVGTVLTEQFPILLYNQRGNRIKMQEEIKTVIPSKIKN